MIVVHFVVMFCFEGLQVDSQSIAKFISTCLKTGIGWIVCASNSGDYFIKGL